ncbi:hypothetical protein [Sphingomonas bacterium]|uniref:hypothetical protein n=1 Tax=Sphingomonas bacterium TaxID=1895847 RepID=UPI001575511A|nr:hypothetical protein [Sphingomonas bacterium]
MSATEKAFGLVRTIFAYQERMDGLDDKFAALSGDVVRLTESHVALRDRVSRIEGLIEGAAMAARQPRIEG